MCYWTSVTRGQNPAAINAGHVLNEFFRFHSLFHAAQHTSSCFHLVALYSLYVFVVVMHHCVHLIWPCHVQYVLWSDLINKSLFLHLHQFHWFSSLLMSRWFHTESDHPMTATDVRVHYLHSWSWMMKCFPSVVSEWRKWKTLNQSHAILPHWIWFWVCFLRSGEARSLCSYSLERKPPQTSKYIETVNAHISRCFLFGSNLSIGNSESSKGIHICTTMLLALL